MNDLSGSDAGKMPEDCENSLFSGFWRHLQLETASLATGSTSFLRGSLIAMLPTPLDIIGTCDAEANVGKDVLIRDALQEAKMILCD